MSYSLWETDCACSFHPSPWNATFRQLRVFHTLFQVKQNPPEAVPSIHRRQDIRDLTWVLSSLSPELHHVCLLLLASRHPWLLSRLKNTILWEIIRGRFASVCHNWVLLWDRGHLWAMLICCRSKNYFLPALERGCIICTLKIFLFEISIQTCKRCHFVRDKVSL